MTERCLSALPAVREGHSGDKRQALSPFGSPGVAAAIRQYRRSGGHPAEARRTPHVMDHLDWERE